MPKILVVDDEPNVVKMISSRLMDSGYEVASAVNGKDALDKVKGDKPNLIILDILMPEMDGFSAAVALKNDPWTKSIPVIFLTCLVESAEMEEAHALIAGNVFLSKPFEAEELLSMVKMMVK